MPELTDRKVVPKVVGSKANTQEAASGRSSTPLRRERRDELHDQAVMVQRRPGWGTRFVPQTPSPAWGTTFVPQTPSPPGGLRLGPGGQAQRRVSGVRWNVNFFERAWGFGPVEHRSSTKPLTW